MHGDVEHGGRHGRPVGEPVEQQHSGSGTFDGDGGCWSDYRQLHGYGICGEHGADRDADGDVWRAHADLHHQSGHSGSSAYAERDEREFRDGRRGRDGNGVGDAELDGAGAVTVSAGSVTGTGYTISGVSFPLTLNPGQTATLGIAFSPTAAGAVNGTVTLTSNSSAGTTSTISLSGTGQPVLNGLTCANGSMTGAGTDTCTVTLNAAAGTGGQSVSLTSSNSAVTVLASVTVASGATAASFSATVSAVSTAQTATLTASSGGATESFTISFGPAVPTLTLQSTRVAFGDVTDGSPAYESVTLTSSGTAPLIISAGSITGTGYSMSGVSFPVTLNPGQTPTLGIAFNPTAAGLVNGTVTLTSNSSTGTTSTISLSGTGVAASSSYEVNLTWEPPTDSTDPLAGYNIYRAISGSSTYQLLNSSPNLTTAYTDATVQNGMFYTYFVESIDAEGHQSAPSNTYTVTIP